MYEGGERSGVARGWVKDSERNGWIRKIIHLWIDWKYFFNLVISFYFIKGFDFSYYTQIASVKDSHFEKSISKQVLNLIKFVIHCAILIFWSAIPKMINSTYCLVISKMLLLIHCCEWQKINGLPMAMKEVVTNNHVHCFLRKMYCSISKGFLKIDKRNPPLYPQHFLTLINWNLNQTDFINIFTHLNEHTFWIHLDYETPSCLYHH